MLEAKEAFDFLEALQYGGKIRFTFPTVGEKYQFDIPNQLAGEINPQYKDWVNKLVTIQNKTGVFLNLPENGLTYGDVENIEEVCSIVTNGVVTLSNRDMIISMSDDLISTLAQRKEEGKPPLRWRISHPDHSMDLLGEILSLGPTIQEFQGDYFGYEDNKKVVKEDSFYPVTFKNVTIEKRYPRWSASK